MLCAVYTLESSILCVFAVCAVYTLESSMCASLLETLYMFKKVSSIIRSFNYTQRVSPLDRFDNLSFKPVKNSISVNSREMCYNQCQNDHCDYIRQDWQAE